MPAMNRKFQRSRRRFSISSMRAVLAHLAVVLAGGAERLVELLQQVGQLEMRGRLEGIVIAPSDKRHADNRKPLAARGVVDVGHVPGQLVGIDRTR